MTRLSIITVNLNNALGLRRTIESVIAQTFTDYEYIIIDGGSTDESVEIIEEFSDRIAYWISEPDKGIYNAMNKGIAKGSGEYYQFLNSGDCFYDASILEKIFKQEIKEEIIYTDGFFLRKDSTLKKFITPGHLNLLFMVDHSLMHPGTFIAGKTFSKLGFYNENLRITSDTEFFIKAYMQGIHFQKVNLASVVVEPDGLSQKNHKLIKDEQLKIIQSNTDEDYYQLFISRLYVIDQLSFFKKSRLLRFLLRHKETPLVNKILGFI